jgi:3-deoxy-7-phosphoheptulonate synthase
MVVVMSKDATESDVARVVERVKGAGGDAFVSRGVARTIIGLVGDIEAFRDL